MNFDHIIIGPDWGKFISDQFNKYVDILGSKHNWVMKILFQIYLITLN